MNRSLPGTKNRASRIRRQWLSGTFATVWTALIGVVLVLYPIGDGVIRLSYDLPFVFRHVMPAASATRTSIALATPGWTCLRST